MDENKIALVIGTNNYKDAGLNLEFAEDDAREMKEILSDKTLYNYKVIDMIDRSHTEVFKKIEELLINAKQEDFILIYFSGHGKLDVNSIYYLMIQNSTICAPLHCLLRWSRSSW
jgi:uncharacterized caspase-like protein